MDKNEALKILTERYFSNYDSLVDQQAGDWTLKEAGEDYVVMILADCCSFEWKTRAEMKISFDLDSLEERLMFELIKANQNKKFEGKIELFVTKKSIFGQDRKEVSEDEFEKERKEVFELCKVAFGKELENDWCALRTQIKEKL